MNYLVFVYGTLKNGHQRFSALRGERYIGIACTDLKYTMYEYGGYPALIESADQHPAQKIYGELYEINNDCMEKLDKVEGVSHGLFYRKQINLETITMSHLPVGEQTWNHIVNKTATAYFFSDQQKLQSAKNCGQIWTLR